ncbi:MAG: hypothetical protein ACQEXX_01850 [Bacillota bacterium]
MAKTTSKKINCFNCGALRAESYFYSNNNPLFNSSKLNVCKKCISDYIGDKDSDDYLDRVYMVLGTMNKPFIETLWLSSDCNWNKYIPQISSFHKDLNFSDSVFIESTSENPQYDQLAQQSHSDETKLYSVKWMGEYTKADIDHLEEYYTGLDRDFKIVTTNHKDYAKKICKASLHMDKCFQEVLSGVKGADKRYKDAKEVFDTLSKSAQFSESQRGQNDVSLGCFGVTFDQVEQKKWIPKHTNLDPDSYDKILEQFATIRESV